MPLQVMLNVLVLLMSSNWVVVKDVGAAHDPFGFAFLRFFVAAAAFSPFLRSAWRDQRIVRAGLELGGWFAGGYLMQSLGLMTTDASRASFLSTFTVSPPCDLWTARGQPVDSLACTFTVSAPPCALWTACGQPVDSLACAARRT